MTLSDSYLIDLLSQHSLQGHDLRHICELAAVDNLVSQVEDWSFEQFFGLAVYMFVTTELAEVRQQLSGIIPKFGSRAVWSLVKIVHQSELPAELQLLARYSLEQVSPYGLTYGLSQMLAAGSEYETFALKTLAELAQQRDEPIMLLLSQLLPSDRWQALEPRLLEWMPTVSAFARAEEQSRHVMQDMVQAA